MFQYLFFKVKQSKTISNFLGELYIQLGELEKAEEVYTGLIDRNTENVKLVLYISKLSQLSSMKTLTYFQLLLRLTYIKFNLLLGLFLYLLINIVGLRNNFA